MKLARILGIAFLLQFFTSLIGNAVFKAKVVFPEDVERTLTAIKADNSSLSIYIALSVGTAFGVVFLGYMLYKNLNHLKKRATFAAFVAYALEGLSLLISLGYSYALLRLANSSGNINDAVSAGSGLVSIAESLSGNIHMVLFCSGAFLFYYYLLKSDIVARPISLWGLICIPFLFVFTVLSFFSIEIPFALYLPYVPFELVIGLALLFGKKGRREGGEQNARFA